MLPDITHLQAFIIQLIAKDEHSGRYLRSRLAEAGEPKSPAAFYQIMARMEKAGLVAGHYMTSVVKGQTIKERRYHATITGMQKFLESAAFYSRARKKSRISQILEKTLSQGPDLKPQA